MKRTFLALTLVLLLTLLLPVPAFASAAQSTTYYTDSHISSDGVESSVNGEYIVLNDDGTGMVVYRRCAYGLNWTQENGQFHFVDSMGWEFTGTLENGLLQGTFHGFEYAYQAGEPAPVTQLSPETWNNGLPSVVDQADILMDIEETQLAQKAEALTEKYGCSVYIVTLDDLRNFSCSYSVETCAEEIRTGYDLGSGWDRDCIMLLLSMAERDYDLVAYGEFGNVSFTDYGKTYLSDRFLDDFRNDSWYSGFEDYLDACDLLLRYSKEGRPVDVNNRPANKPLAAGASAVIAFLVGLIVASSFKAGMKPTKAKTTAAEYIPQNGVNISYRYDQYTHTTETRVYDPPSKSGGSGGGGGTSHSSSGHSHSSGKF